MKVSELKNDELNIKIIDKILFEGIENTTDNGDCILVLGSSSANKYRVPKAIEIYKQNRANKILMSGGRILNNEFGQESEAYLMKKSAVNNGILESDILIEEVSLTTKENMICSQLELERYFKLGKIKRVLLVTTRYHMRRSLLMARKYMPNWIEIVPCPADDTNTLRHNWSKSERGFKRAKEETIKIISYIKEGSIDDFEI